MTAEFALHSTLDRDTVLVGDLPLCRVLAMDDLNYPWLVLVPRQPGLVEIIDLRDNDQQTLMTEIARVARALKTATACDKLNIAALGNSVPQLHVHVIARFRNDAGGPRPVWGAVAPRPYGADAMKAFCDRMRTEIGL